MLNPLKRFWNLICVRVDCNCNVNHLRDHLHGWWYWGTPMAGFRPNSEIIGKFRKLKKFYIDFISRKASRYRFLRKFSISTEGLFKWQIMENSSEFFRNSQFTLSWAWPISGKLTQKCYIFSKFQFSGQELDRFLENSFNFSKISARWENFLTVRDKTSCQF